MTVQRVIVGITGGVAAYKSVLLVRLLRAAKMEVQVVMTAAAKQFVTKTTLQALSQRPVRDDLWDEQAEMAMGHIELAKWADAIVIAPATADVLARLAHGLADDLLTTLCLASTAQQVVVPAMNQAMWLHPATQANVACLRSRDVQFVGPVDGEQACGDCGPGRMAEPAAIVEHLQSVGSRSESMAGQTIVITAGPTQEPIDPVRYLGNRSSGKMGYALARKAARMGARVILVSGPTALLPPDGVEFVAVQTAEQMHQAVMQRLQGADLFFAVAAVADYTVVDPKAIKIKKESSNMTVQLTRTVDIVGRVCQQKKRPFVVAFAAETNAVMDHALSKWRRKGCDMLVVNDVSEGKVFGRDQTEVTVLSAQGQQHWGPGFKDEFASELLYRVLEYRQSRVDLPHTV